MAKIHTGLGRGLGALISDVNSIQQAAGKPVAQTQPRPLVSTSEIEISRIEPNPYQPRTEFDPEALEELASSIRLLGLIQPITLRPLENGRYQIISGERRFRASRLAGLTKVPAYIRRTDDRGMLEMAIVENIQREDLDSIEVALSFQRLIDECHLTQEEMAGRVGKKRATVTNYLRLLRLPAEIQFAIKARKISMGHAKALLSVDDDKAMLRLADQIIAQDLSVRQTEQKVQKLAQQKEKQENEEKEPVIELPDSHFKVIEIVGKYFNNNVMAKRNAKGAGEFTIHFNNDREVEDFLSALEHSNI